MDKHMKISISYIKSVDGGYVGVINEVRGVVAQGETIKELKSNLHEALVTMFKFTSEMNSININTKNNWSTRKMTICA